MREEKRLKLPVNIKQVGSISQGIKIYVEDYVYTYIQQYASFAECDEKIGVLTGKKEVFDNDDVLFINGIIQGKYSVNEAGMEILSEKSREYIKEQMELYFSDDEILGWVYIQPGYGDFLNNSLISYHEKNFKKYYNVLFIYDPLEKVNGFFCKNEVMGGLEAIKGYFIYYDRNEGMHEYMLKNRLIRPKETTENAEYNYEFSENPETIKKVDATVEKMRSSLSKERVSKPRTIRNRGKIVTEQKKLVNFLGTLSAVLFCACFVMGASIIKNDDRINNVEKQVAAMDNSYTYLIKTIKEGNVQNVFAAHSGDNTAKLTEKETQTEKTTEKQTEKPTEKQTEKQTEKPTEKQTEKQTQKPVITAAVPVSPKKPAAENTQKTVPNKYKIEAGDSLSGISIRFYGTNKKVEEIMAKNGLDDPDKIYYGMIIELP